MARNKLNKTFENLRKWFKFNTKDSWKPLAYYWGPGIKKQMEQVETNEEVYKTITLEQLEKIVLDLVEELKETSDRELICRVGKKGALQYLRTRYEEHMFCVGRDKNRIEKTIQNLLAKDEKEIKEGIYRIDSTGLHYEGTYNK